MISLHTAQKLKDAGLQWVPALHDFFVIPDRNLDERIFVISEMLVTIESLQEKQMIMFQGASEWALDMLVTYDSVWMPTEEQLRETLEKYLLAQGTPVFDLMRDLDGYQCKLRWNGEYMTFRHQQPCEAYAAAILYIIDSLAGRILNDGA